MSQSKETKYIRRTQKDYSYAFKLQIVQEIERGQLTKSDSKKKYGIQGDATIRNWLRKYGNFDWENQNSIKMSKTSEQKIMELEQKIKLLEKQNKHLEHQVERGDKKIILFDMMIDIAEEEFNIPIRKKSLPEQSSNSKESTKKQ